MLLDSILNEIFTKKLPVGTEYKRIAEISVYYAYLDQIVDRMIRQSRDRRYQNIC